MDYVEAHSFEEFLNRLTAKDLPVFFKDTHTHLVYFVGREKAYIVEEKEWNRFLEELKCKVIGDMI